VTWNIERGQELTVADLSRDWHLLAVAAAFEEATGYAQTAPSLPS
jgi:hypothetical protein